MRTEQHEAIARWERRWLALMGGLLVVLVVLMGYSLYLEGGHIGRRTQGGTPAELTALEMFASPGVVETSPGRFRVSIVGQAFSFVPAVVQLPVGAQVTFFATSRDVLHGYQVQNTNINVELIPGQVAAFDYTFDRPGTYRIACNEYCGISHQNMVGFIEVLEASEYEALQAQQAEAAAAAGEADAGADAESLAVGQRVYSTTCAGCHQATGQGLPAIFPPLAGHAADLYAVPGGRDYLVNVVLYGVTGPISVHGTTYTGQMPSWAALSDEEIAGVLNYVLNAWGDDVRLAGGELPFQASDIEPYRAQALTQEEVLELRTALAIE